jgi:hypothetical protein
MLLILDGRFCFRLLQLGGPRNFLKVEKMIQQFDSRSADQATSHYRIVRTEVDSSQHTPAGRLEAVATGSASIEHPWSYGRPAIAVFTRGRLTQLSKPGQRFPELLRSSVSCENTLKLS